MIIQRELNVIHIMNNVKIQIDTSGHTVLKVELRFNLFKR